MSVYDQTHLDAVQRIYDAVKVEVAGGDIANHRVKEAIAKAVLAMDAAGQRDGEKIARYAAHQGRVALSASDIISGMVFTPCPLGLAHATRLKI